MEVGDRVRIIERTSIRLELGDTGTIIMITDHNLMGIEFDRYINGHDCGGVGKPGYCYNVRSHALEVIEDDESGIIKWYKNGELI